MGQDDEDVGNLLNRAHALMCQFKYTEALPLVQRAVELVPQSLEAWRELGTAYGYLGRVADLEQAFERALRLAAAAANDPDADPEEAAWEDAITWYARGNAENNAGAWSSALRSFTMFAELDPDWGAPWLMCGMVLGNMGVFVDSRYHEQALAALDRALELELSRVTDERIAYDLKAKSLFGLGRREEAEACSQHAAELRRAEQTERAKQTKMD